MVKLLRLNVKYCSQATSRRERDDETDYGDNGQYIFDHDYNHCRLTILSIFTFCKYSFPFLKIKFSLYFLSFFEDRFVLKKF